MRVGVVGLGLIGGSIARDLKSQINVTVYGVDKNETHTEQAKELGLVHEIISIGEVTLDADVIIVATPVDVIERLIPQILDTVGPQTVVIDVGSTKSDICDKVKNHPNRHQFVAAHPLAGTEFSGPEAALKGLFQNAKNIICEKDKSSDRALEIALKVFESIGMNTLFMSAEEHDRHLAYVSHLSHVTSFSLGLTVLDIEKDEKQIFNLASTGFRSTSRLAKSNPQTWKAIFGRNRKYLGEALDGYIKTLSEFRDAIKENDVERMEELMTEANDIKRILN
ncbi:MAG: prephenate dehydrogenase [Saprospiraceae bacterium]|nr:prephenate dehydrogenase [Saprospiraceae bacterium]